MWNSKLKLKIKPHLLELFMKVYLALKEKLFQSKYVFSKAGQFRSGSQGNHPTALNTYEVWDDFYL